MFYSLSLNRSEFSGAEVLFDTSVDRDGLADLEPDLVVQLEPDLVVQNWGCCDGMHADKVSTFP
jgi:hypothetical protein